MEDTSCRDCFLDSSLNVNIQISSHFLFLDVPSLVPFDELLLSICQIRKQSQTKSFLIIFSSNHYSTQGTSYDTADDSVIIFYPSSITEFDLLSRKSSPSESCNRFFRKYFITTTNLFDVSFLNERIVINQTSTISS